MAVRIDPVCGRPAELGIQISESGVGRGRSGSTGRPDSSCEARTEIRSPGGRPGESSNPLYRGFENQSKEDVERYDQPVLVRLNARDGAELAGGFPKTAEDLFAYHAVVVDDLEAEFFTRAIKLALPNASSPNAAAGFSLCWAGPRAFIRAAYERTPVGDMLPVYLDPPPVRERFNQPPPVPHPRRLAATLGPLRSNETEEKSRIETMPTFQTLNRVRDVKPGASVIATVQDGSGTTYPAPVVVQRFGNGRVGAQ